MNVSETLEIPVLKPDVEQINSVNISVDIFRADIIKVPVSPVDANGDYVSNLEGKVSTGRKLIIEGLLKQKIIYTAAVDEQSIHSASFVIPFSTFIIIEKDTPLSQKFRITPYVEDIFAYRLSERSVFKNS